MAAADRYARGAPVAAPCYAAALELGTEMGERKMWGSYLPMKIVVKLGSSCFLLQRFEVLLTDRVREQLFKSHRSLVVF